MDETKDYSDLYDMEFKIIMRDGAVYDGMLAAIDPDIGITIVHRDNETARLVCVHGPLSRRKQTRRPVDKDYKTVFEFIVKSIEEGKLVAQELADLIITDALEGLPSAFMHCPFDD